MQGISQVIHRGILHGHASITCRCLTATGQGPAAQKSPGMKINDLNYDLHVGQAMGFIGKMLAFLASLICASLPVTGFIIWLGKKK